MERWLHAGNSVVSEPYHLSAAEIVRFHTFRTKCLGLTVSTELAGELADSVLFQSSAALAALALSDIRRLLNTSSRGASSERDAAETLARLSGRESHDLSTLLVELQFCF